MESRGLLMALASRSPGVTSVITLACGCGWKAGPVRSQNAGSGGIWQVDNSRKSRAMDCASYSSRLLTAIDGERRGRAGVVDFRTSQPMTNNGEWTMIAARRFPGLRRMVVSRGLWGVVLSGVLVSGSCWLSAADEAPSAGLRGVLPAAIPSDLAATIETLPENWKEWGTALNGELTTLYVTDNVDVAGQRQAIAALRARKATLDKHSGDPRYRSILTQLVSLSGSLKRRLDLAEAALDSIAAGPGLQHRQASAAGRQVAEAARALESKLGAVSTGPGWVKYLQIREVRSTLSGGNSDNVLATLTAVQTRLKGKEELADARAR